MHHLSRCGVSSVGPCAGSAAAGGGPRRPAAVVTAAAALAASARPFHSHHAALRLGWSDRIIRGVRSVLGRPAAPAEDDAEKKEATAADAGAPSTDGTDATATHTGDVAAQSTLTRSTAESSSPIDDDDLAAEEFDQAQSEQSLLSAQTARDRQQEELEADLAKAEEDEETSSASENPLEAALRDEVEERRAEGEEEADEEETAAAATTGSVQSKVPPVPTAASSLARSRARHLSRHMRPTSPDEMYRLVQLKDYSGAISHFRSHWKNLNRSLRRTLSPRTLEGFITSLAALHQYEEILDFYCDLQDNEPFLCRIWHEEPTVLDLLLQACIRHPAHAPVKEICTALYTADRLRERAHSFTVAAAPATGSRSAPAPKLVLLLTEKVANQLLKSALLRQDARLALRICLDIFMGQSRGWFEPRGSRQAPAHLEVSLYASRSYRLHSQASHGLILYLLQKQAYSRDQASSPPPTMMIPSPSPLSDTHTYPHLTFHTDLFRAFHMYLHTSFIEQLQDTELLFRIFNTVLCAVLSPPTLPPNASSSGQEVARAVRQKNAWLAFQIYKFVLRHNESIGRVETSQRKLNKGMWSPATPGSSSASGRGGGGGSGGGDTGAEAMAKATQPKKDTPWSYTHHRRYIQLQWAAHHKPLMEICLLRLAGEGPNPPADALLPPSSSSAEIEATFDAAQWLEVLLYDVRLSHTDYTVLRSNRELTAENRAEIDALELSEASQAEELALYATRVRPGSAAGSLFPLPPVTLLPNLALRPLDAAMFCALARRYVRCRDFVALVGLYQSVPAASMFAHIRADIVRIAQQGTAHAPPPTARQLVQDTRDMLKAASDIAQTWRDPQAIQARREGSNGNTTADAGETPAPAPAPAATTAGLQLQPLSVQELSEPSALLRAINVHANACSENTASALSFLLRLFVPLSEFGTCFHLFNPDFWRVQPSRSDFESILVLMQCGQFMRGGTDIVRALQRTLMLHPASFRPLETLAHIADAYQALTGLPKAMMPAALSASATLAISCVGNGEGHVVRDVAENLWQLYSYIYRVHMTPILQALQTATAAEAETSDPSAAAPPPMPSSLPLLLRYLQSYIAWRSQHQLSDSDSGSANSGSSSNIPRPEATYVLLARAYPDVPGITHTVQVQPEAAATGAAVAAKEGPPTQLALEDLPEAYMLVVENQQQWRLLDNASRDRWLKLINPDSSNNAVAPAVSHAAATAAVPVPSSTIAATTAALVQSSPLPTAPPAKLPSPSVAAPAFVKSVPTVAAEVVVAPASVSDPGADALGSIRAGFGSRRASASAAAKGKPVRPTPRDQPTPVVAPATPAAAAPKSAQPAVAAARASVATILSNVREKVEVQAAVSVPGTKAAPDASVSVSGSSSSSSSAEDALYSLPAPHDIAASYKDMLEASRRGDNFRVGLIYWRVREAYPGHTVATATNTSSGSNNSLSRSTGSSSVAESNRDLLDRLLISGEKIANGLDYRDRDDLLDVRRGRLPKSIRRLASPQDIAIETAKRMASTGAAASSSTSAFSVLQQQLHSVLALQLRRLCGPRSSALSRSDRDGLWFECVRVGSLCRGSLPALLVAPGSTTPQLAQDLVATAAAQARGWPE